MPANRKNPGVHHTARQSRDRKGALAASVAGMRSLTVAARMGLPGRPLLCRAPPDESQNGLDRLRPGHRGAYIVRPLAFIVRPLAFSPRGTGLPSQRRNSRSMGFQPDRRLPVSLAQRIV
jgi:hypothetical protein